MLVRRSFLISIWEEAEFCEPVQRPIKRRMEPMLVHRSFLTPLGCSSATHSSAPSGKKPDVVVRHQARVRAQIALCRSLCRAPRPREADKALGVGVSPNSLRSKLPEHGSELESVLLLWRDRVHPTEREHDKAKMVRSNIRHSSACSSGRASPSQGANADSKPLQAVTTDLLGKGRVE